DSASASAHLRGRCTAARTRRTSGVRRSDGALPSQSVDLVGTDTEFGENRFGVLPESGHRTHRSLVAGDDGRRQQGLNRTGGCFDLPPTVARRQLRVDQNFARQVVPRIAYSSGVPRFFAVV